MFRIAQTDKMAVLILVLALCCTALGEDTKEDAPRVPVEGALGWKLEDGQSFVSSDHELARNVDFKKVLVSGRLPEASLGFQREYLLDEWDSKGHVRARVSFKNPETPEQVEGAPKLTDVYELIPFKEQAGVLTPTLGATFRNFSCVNMGGSGDASLYGNALSMNRLEILWASCEPTEGNWNQSYLDNYAAGVLERNNNNVETLVLLAYAAPWSASPSPQVHIGSHPAYISTEHIPDWVNYVEKVVKHLSAPPYDVEYFQIWNEPWKHPNCGFWGGSDDEFFTNAYLPGAAKIRELGGKVVYGGWPSCEDLSTWIALLDKHKAWDDTDVLSFHYQSGWTSVWAWPRMRGASTSQGFPNMPIWTTEVGSINSASWFPDWYSKLFYWAVANGADKYPDMVKTFYFKLNENDPGSYHYNRDLYRKNVITERGLALQAMADVFDGGPVTAYTNFTNDRGLKPDIATFGHGASAVEGFDIHAKPRRIVVAFQLREDDLKDPATDRILLTYPELDRASDVVSVKRIDVSGYATDLKPRYSGRSLKVTVPISNDSASPAQSWKLGKGSPFFVVVTLRQ